MKLSFAFLCLLLATLSLASIPSAEKERSSLSFSKKGEKDGGTPSATGKPSKTTKKLVRNRKRALKKRLKKRIGATKGVEKTLAGEKLLAASGSGKDSQGDSVALSFFPKVLVELIGGYLEGSFSVVFTRDWPAAYSSNRVAVDRERHYLITDQDVQASSHGDSEQVNIGSPDLSRYKDFQSSHDGRSLFLAGKSQEQVSRYSSEKTARWLAQDTGTENLKSVTIESGESSFAGNSFILSANGRTLVSTSLNTWTTSVYQIKEHGKTASASKKACMTGYAYAVSGNGNRVLMEPEKGQLEIHDVSGDENLLVLKIRYAGAAYTGSCALSSDGSNAAFIDREHRLCVVDVDKQKGSISADQLTAIDAPDSFIRYSLIYDAKDRLYVFTVGNLWLVDPSKSELVSLEEAEVPQGYKIQSSAISPSVDYIALLIRSDKRNEKGKCQYQIVVKRREDKDVLMRFFGH